MHWGRVCNELHELYHALHETIESSFLVIYRHYIELSFIQFMSMREVFDRAPCCCLLILPINLKKIGDGGYLFSSISLNNITCVTYMMHSEIFYELHRLWRTNENITWCSLLSHKIFWKLTNLISHRILLRRM